MQAGADKTSMKKLLTILAAGSLALALTAKAENEQNAAGQKKKQNHEEKRGGKEAHRPAVQAHGAREMKSNGNTANLTPKSPQGVHKEHAQTHIAGPKNTPKAISTPLVNPETNIGANGAGKNKKEHAQRFQQEQAGQFKKEHNGSNDAAINAANRNFRPDMVNRQHPNHRLGGAKKPDRQVLEKIKTEHASFRAQPRPEKVPAVAFNQNYRINGSDRWQGEKYARFRSYHPEMHDRGWYSSHYNRVEVIGGGAYYWNNGYWYPAWGYDTSAQYYPYDGPIYVGTRAEPPDRVIADVQAVLQEQGYYRGEVDGLLGPLTRQALNDYQADNGLYTTSAIDEPTLDSLGMG